MKSINQGIIQILKSAPVGIFLSDRAGNYSFVNDYWSMITGLEVHEAVGNGWITALHPEDKSKVILEWQKAASLSTNFEQEFRFKNNTNSVEYWVICRTVAIPFTSGSDSPGYIGTVTDISLQKEGQDALNNTNSFLDSVIENIPNMIFMKEAEDLKFVLFNKAGEDLLGVDRKELFGKNDYDFFPTNQAKSFIERDREVLKSDKLLLIPEEPIDTTKGRKYLRTRKIPLRSPVGNKLYLLGISEDITAEKKALDELNESEARFRNMADSSRVLIWIADIAKRFTYFNKPWLDFTGASLDQQSGQGWLESVHKEDLEYVKIMFDAAFERKKPFSIDYRLLRSDGEYRWIRSQGAPLLNTNSEFDGFIGSCFDITETILATEKMEKAKLAAEEATRSKSLFLANMSHEIRTPMNAIIGMADLLMRTDLNDEQQDFAQTIVSSASSLLSILNDILDYSKIEARKLEIYSHTFSLDSLLKEIEATFKPHGIKKQISFNIEKADDRLNFVRGDEVRIRQILNNLVSNAIKFSRAEGRVDLRITSEINSCDTQIVSFEVKDGGIGISKEQQSYIFDAFAQADPTITRNYGGTGLGLSIVGQLVELMGGEICLSSELDKGSLFCVKIPLQNAEAITVSSSEAINSQIILDGLKILLVEDNQINQKLAKKVLEKAGSKVELAESGELAILLRQQENFSLILMDIQMPGMDGMTATKTIREWERANNKSAVPIIAMTAHAMQGDRERFLEAGMNEYISKPFDRTLLLKTIEKLTAEQVQAEIKT